LEDKGSKNNQVFDYAYTTVTDYKRWIINCCFNL